MSKCKFCGNHGLFLRVNSEGLCSNCASKQRTYTSNLIQSPQAEVAKQDNELKRLLKAEELYANDNDIQRLISVYEDVFIVQRSTLISQSRWFSLVDLYLKAGQNDKAWAWLNQLSIQHPDYLSKIEEKRYKILNKERRYVDAMLSLMASIGYTEGNQGPLAYYQAYGKNKFLKAAPPLIKKLNWSTTDLESLEALLSSSIGNKRFNYSSLRDGYRKFIEAKDVQHDNKT